MTNHHHTHSFKYDGLANNPHTQVSHHNAQHDGSDLADLLSHRYRGVSIYLVAMIALVIGIIGTGINIAEQTMQYRQDYQTLKNKEKTLSQLQIEHQRLLIEQQTFSATPQIAARAVAQLRMYSPKLSEKLIVQPVSIKGMPQTTTPNQNQHRQNQHHQNQQNIAQSINNKPKAGQ